MSINALSTIINDEADFEAQVAAYQELINSGQVWQMEGAMGREAMRLLKLGYCALGTTAHRDYYGNRIPSRFEVQAGTKGSVELVRQQHGREPYGTWQVHKTCKCGTHLVIEHELTPTSQGTSVVEGCGLLSRKRQLPRSAVCSGCGRQHRFDSTWKAVQNG